MYNIKLNIFVFHQQIVDYHRIIKKPIALDVIRDKLKPKHPNHYTDLRQVMADIRLMFKNAFTYNPVSFVLKSYNCLSSPITVYRVSQKES